MTYEIINTTHPQILQYSAFVRSHENGHFLQSPTWAGAKSLWFWRGILVKDDTGIILGVMSVLLRPLGKYWHIAYAPRAPVCDRRDGEVLRILTQGTAALAKQYRCLLTYLDPDEVETNGEFRRIMQDLGFRERRSDAFGGVQAQNVFRLDLTGKDEEVLLASFSQKTRYNIRLSQRKGVLVTEYPGNRKIPPQVLDQFAILMETTGERDHFLVRGKQYFEGLLSALGEDSVLYMAYLNGIPIAGTIGVFYGKKAWYLYGASANECRAAMPNYLLQWNMLQEARRRGCAIYDFRGVPGTGQPEDPLYGLYRFKKGFGGTHIRFTGLFALYHRPVLGRIVDLGQYLFRKIRKNRPR